MQPAAQRAAEAQGVRRTALPSPGAEEWRCSHAAGLRGSAMPGLLLWRGCGAAEEALQGRRRRRQKAAEARRAQLQQAAAA